MNQTIKKQGDDLKAFLIACKWLFVITAVFSFTLNGLLIQQLQEAGESAIKTKYNGCMVSLEQEVKLNNELMRGK